MENSPQCMIYIPWKTESMNEDTILFGDDQGKFLTCVYMYMYMFEIYNFVLHFLPQKCSYLFKVLQLLLFQLRLQ